jgi:hypothetical protein
MKLTNSRINELRKRKRYRHWLDQYALALLFRKKFGRFPEKKKDEFPNGNKLGKWFKDIIIESYRKGHLKLWQVHLLNKINYKFEIPNRWMLNFEALKKGWVEHPKSWPYVYYYTPNLKRIEKWCKDQRNYRSKGNLSQDKIDRLNSKNFAWESPGEIIWEKHYKEILNWVKISKCFPRRYSSDSNERSYALWIAKERSKNNIGNNKGNRATKISKLCRLANYNPIIMEKDQINDQRTISKEEMAIGFKIKLFF